MRRKAVFRPDLEALYGKFLAVPFPRIGGEIGVFAAYGGDIAGLAQRAIEGEVISLAAAPTPDGETVAFVLRVRGAQHRTPSESEFLEYFDLLESVRALLEK